MHGLQLLLRGSRTQQHHQQRELGTPDLQDSGVVASLSNLWATAGVHCAAMQASSWLLLLLLRIPAPTQQQPVWQGTAAPPCLTPQ